MLIDWIQHKKSSQIFFDKNISNKLFDNKITFVNSQCENTNSKGDFVLKNRFETYVLKTSGIQISILLRFGVTNSINKHLLLYISYTHKTNFNPKLLFIAFAKPNLSQKYMLYSRNLKRTYLLNLCSCGVNSLKLLCSQKAGGKGSY